MTDDGKGPASPDFSERLKAAQERRAAKRGAGRRGGNVMRSDLLGMAYRASIELIIPPLVGAFLGWLIDGWLGTRPGFLLGLFALGGAAGVMNVVRTMRNMSSGGPDSGPK